MRFSIVVPTLNRAAYLNKALESLVNLDYKESYEVLIVDNNSKDNTRQVVESFGPKFSVPLRYLLEKKSGIVYAKNHGVRQAKGEIVAFVDDDAAVDKQWLACLDRTFKDHPDVDILAGKILPMDSDETAMPDWFKDYKGSVLGAPFNIFDMGDSYLEFGKKEIFPIGTNSSYKRSSFDKFGFFAPGTRMEDILIANSWNNQKAKIAYAPDAIVYHYMHPHRMSKPYFRKYFFQTGVDHAGIFAEKYDGERKLFKVPLWLYRKLLTDSVYPIKGLFKSSKGDFEKELLFWHIFGVIVCKLGVKFNFTRIQ